MKTSIEVIVEVEIVRPPSVVWSFLSDVDRMPEWLLRDGLAAILRHDPRDGLRDGFASPSAAN